RRGEPIQIHWRESGKAEASRRVGSTARLGNASGALARGDLWQGKAESIGQPASPGLRQHRQLAFEQRRLFPGAGAFRSGLEQFGQELVGAFAFSLEVGP